MKLFHISLLSALLYAPAAGAQTAQHLNATKANDYAIVYSLPRTAIDITVEAEITVKKPGEFFKYAPKYLHVNNPITAESHSARILSAKIYTHGTPNSEERYSIQFKPGNPVAVALDEAGIPLAINTDETAPSAMPELPQPREAAPTPLETPAARQAVSEDMLRSQSTAKRAELAAQAIFAIRQTRSDLISGQADNMPPDGKSMQLMLDNLQAQEEALTAMFIGTTSTRTEVVTYTVSDLTLDDTDSARLIIARLSAIEGLTDADDLAGTPIYLDLSVVQRGEAPVNEKGQTLPFPKNGVPYTIPGQVKATLQCDGETCADATLDIAQLGITYGLAPNSFTNRKDPIYIIYDPATGALLRQGAAAR